MIEITAIPAFKDNYIWLLHPTQASQDAGHHCAAVVDPGDADVVFEVLSKKKLSLAAILVTHHHWDHVNGIEKLLSIYDAAVFGPRNSPVKLITHPLDGDESFDLPGNLGSCHALATPGHTLDHLSYHIENHLFCGDTLFSAGCGRLFEGSPQQMWQSLNILSQLPTNTHIYAAHEYTQANLRFANAVEANNPAVLERMDEVQRLRNAGKASLPSTMAIELSTNPFLRCHINEVQQSVSLHAQRTLSDTVDTFTELRKWKDTF